MRLGVQAGCIVIAQQRAQRRLVAASSLRATPREAIAIIDPTALLDNRASPTQVDPSSPFADPTPRSRRPTHRVG
jgi:hypothetical protein